MPLLLRNQRHQHQRFTVIAFSLTARDKTDDFVADKYLDFKGIVERNEYDAVYIQIITISNSMKALHQNPIRSKYFMRVSFFCYHTWFTFYCRQDLVKAYLVWFLIMRRQKMNKMRALHLANVTWTRLIIYMYFDSERTQTNPITYNQPLYRETFQTWRSHANVNETKHKRRCT